MQGINVVTDYSFGTSIHMAHDQTKWMIESTAISLLLGISTVNIFREDFSGTKMYVEFENENWNKLVTQYCGNSSSNIKNMLKSNAQILYQFLRGVCDNESVEALVIFRMKSSATNGKWLYELVIDALEEYQEFLLKIDPGYLSGDGTNVIYTAYNKKFRKMMEETFG